MLRSLRATLTADNGARAILVGVVFVVVTAGGFSLTLWRYQMFTNAAAIAVLQVKLDAEIARARVMENSVRLELDGIQRTLYTAPETPGLRKASKIEDWQINRDNELRATIKRFERVIQQLGAEKAAAEKVK